MVLQVEFEAVTRGAAVGVDFLTYGEDMAPLRKEQSGFDVMYITRPL
jgi:hypothetical protein